MTTIAHATIVMERTYAASPKRVFDAWANIEARKRWSAPADNIAYRSTKQPTFARAARMSRAASSLATLTMSPR
jgi:uncharacterized protein YndB with AHSA1/START domain